MGPSQLIGPDVSSTPAGRRKFRPDWKRRPSSAPRPLLIQISLLRSCLREIFLSEEFKTLSPRPCMQPTEGLGTGFDERMEEMEEKREGRQVPPSDFWKYLNIFKSKFSSLPNRSNFQRFVPPSQVEAQEEKESVSLSTCVAVEWSYESRRKKRQQSGRRRDREESLVFTPSSHSTHQRCPEALLTSGVVGSFGISRA